MPSVSNLNVKLQTGTTNTYFATWDFNEVSHYTYSISVNSGVYVGAWVRIKAGATYYNGTHIPTWVMNDSWKVIQITGDRAVINENPSGSHRIMSPIHVGNLEGAGSTSQTQDQWINTTDHYNVAWYYDTGDGVWFSGGSSDTNEKNATYSGPSNANRIKCIVTPVAKTHNVNGTDTPYWAGSGTVKEYSTAADPPVAPSTPSISVNKYTITCTNDNISDPRSDQIEFEIYNDTTLVNKGAVTVRACKATYNCNVNAGGSYRVRSRSINLYYSSKIYSSWSDFSSSVKTIPSAPKGFRTCKATSKTSVGMTWDAVTGADTYDIEYATKISYFDGSDSTSTVTGIKTLQYEKTGLESGNVYYFRFRAVNEKGESAWSQISSTVIGKKPSAPTTWSSTTTAVTGDPLYLYWVHNSEDGSSQTYAELEMYIDGEKQTKTIKNTEDEDLKDKTSSYTIDTSQYKEGTQIQWRVRTAGVTKDYGDWSVQRTIDIYAPATLTIDVTNTAGASISLLTEFPFYISALAGPKTQSPVSYHVLVTSNEAYATIDQIGNEKVVNRNEEIFSKYYDTSEALLVELSAGNIDLQSGYSYTVEVTVAMNSGLTAVESKEFSVDWTDIAYEPDAEIGIDESTYCAYIRPYCLDEDKNLIADILLSVYRREYDGSFTEIATDIENGQNIHVVDPHPALDFARYRIVATAKSTGAVSFYDPPGYPINAKYIIMQWDETWQNFDSLSDTTMEEPAYAGSMLKLPYNIDVSDSNNPDSALVEYVGRKHPVSYYGTQLGVSSTWNTDILKSDKNTLYALRRLQMWMGDIYVREPSGSGYWANVKVSYNIKHRDLTIPVTITITRVEGGM